MYIASEKPIHFALIAMSGSVGPCECSQSCQIEKLVLIVCLYYYLFYTLLTTRPTLDVAEEIQIMKIKKQVP